MTGDRRPVVGGQMAVDGCRWPVVRDGLGCLAVVSGRLPVGRDPKGRGSLLVTGRSHRTRNRWGRRSWARFVGRGTRPVGWLSVARFGRVGSRKQI